MWWRREKKVLSPLPSAADRERAGSYRSESTGDRNEGLALPLNVRVKLACREALTSLSLCAICASESAVPQDACVSSK